MIPGELKGKFNKVTGCPDQHRNQQHSYTQVIINEAKSHTRSIFTVKEIHSPRYKLAERCVGSPRDNSTMSLKDLKILEQMDRHFMLAHQSAFQKLLNLNLETQRPSIKATAVFSLDTKS